MLYEVERYRRMHRIVDCSKSATALRKLLFLEMWIIRQ